MKIIPFNEFNQPYRVIYELWNNEYGLIYPITEELFFRNIINHQGLFVSGSFILLNEEEVVGFIFSKTWNHSYLIPDYDSYGWISLLYIKPSERGKGLGSKLLELAEVNLKTHNKRVIFIGRDYENFFPGLPFDLKSSLAWFERRGYHFSYDTNDLIKQVDDKTTQVPLYESKYLFRFAKAKDFLELRKLIERNWPSRWLVEFDDYVAYNGMGNEYLIALNGERVCAFCKVTTPKTPTKHIGYSLTWRSRFPALGGIGPLGVDKDLRGQKLGYNIVAHAVNYLISEKVSHIIIDWTNLMDFYRIFGFEVWKSYKYLIKEEK